MAVLALALSAAAAKLAIALNTLGTTDVFLFQFFGQFVAEHGLAEAYRHAPVFNHTPLVAWWAMVCRQMAAGDMGLMALLLRLPGIFADLLAVLLILRIRDKTGGPPWWAIGLFAASPVSLMVAGYHGNVDSVLALFMLAAWWFCVDGRPGWSGVALGLACQVKVVPLLLAPVFALWWWRRGRGREFAGPAILVTLAGWLPVLALAPEAFMKAAVGYPGYWGLWGVSYVLRATGLAEFQQTGMIYITDLQRAIMATGKWIVVAGVSALAWWRRGRELALTLAAVWALFFVFAAGVAAQYFVWCAPFVLLVAPRWYAAITAASALFLFHFYTTISGGFPWWRGISQNNHVAMWGPWSLVPWAVFIAFLAWVLPRCVRER